MAARTYRPLFALTAAAIVLLGGAAIFASGSQHAGADTAPYVIEIHDDGFNPPVCNINRGDTVQWKNVGAQPHQVYSPGPGLNGPAFFDSGVLAPGQLSGKLLVDSGVTMHYIDKLNPALTGVVETPSRSNTWTVSCSPVAPTPTPSPTPQPTPTPAVPPRCVGEPGCAVAAELARD